MKTLVEWFQAVADMLQPLRHAHPGAYLGGKHCAMPPHTLGLGTKQKSAKYATKSRNYIIKNMQLEEAYSMWYFNIILISLRVEVEQISDFLVHAKILLL